MTAMAAPGGMDPVLNLLNQRPREDWSWDFKPGETGHDAVNAVALCNAALLTYSDDAGVQRFLKKWQFSEPRMLFGRRTETQGFVARKDNTVIVAFRGTEPTHLIDWLTDVKYQQRKFNTQVPGLVHGGWADALEEVREQMLEAVKAFSSGATPRIFVTGHSLGGALAVLAASVLQSEGKQKIAAVYTYGQPRVGDPEFSAAFDAKLGAVTVRYVNDWDIVPHVPLTRMLGGSASSAQPSTTGIVGKIINFFSGAGQASDALTQEQKFAHVGQLKLLLKDGTVSSDDKLWQERELGFGNEIDNLLGSLPNQLGIALQKIIRADRRILDHDPLNGYLAKLERQLPRE
jgi:triacylglycerol lipase